MKDSLIEIKNNLQGNKSTVDEAETEINDLEHKEAKNNLSEQEIKRIQKNEDNISSLWGTSSVPTFISRDARRGRKIIRNWKSI